MRFKLMGVLLIFCFLICGCASSSKKQANTVNSALLEPQGVLKFSDIPIPVGFKAVPRDSYSFESSGIRVGILKYQGKANIEQVVNFYREQMPMYDWNLLNIVEYGNRLLNFDRNLETCIISLEPKGKYVVSTISIGPKSNKKESRSKIVK
ncbi:MAG: hypothetical protein ABIH18_08340 [Candidatus Omnitrophota bacterium]